MQLDALLERLDRVHSRGPGRFMARCPAHADRSPSLSICEGEDGRILLHDFGGCTVQEIVAAVGLRVTDLFSDARIDLDAMRRREAERYEREGQRELEGRNTDLLRESEYLIRSARNMDISQWSHEQLDTALNALAGAFQRIEREARHG